MPIKERKTKERKSTITKTKTLSSNPSSSSVIITKEKKKRREVLEEKEDEEIQIEEVKEEEEKSHKLITIEHCKSWSVIKSFFFFLSFF